MRGENGVGRPHFQTRTPRLSRAFIALLLLAIAASFASAAPRSLNVQNVTAGGGQEIIVPLLFVSLGDENALGFSLDFNPALMTFRGQTLGASISGASLNVNTNQAAAGRVGFAVAKSTGSTFATGTNLLLNLRFLLAATTGDASLTFGDTPVVRETVDAAAGALTTIYSNGVVTITPQVAPGILTPPAGQTVYSGTNVTLSVVASGSLPLSYQWRRENQPVAGGTNADLILLNVTTNQSGNYRVVVSNSGGSVTSTPALVTVLPPLTQPSILVGPQNQVAWTGETISFFIVAGGSTPFTYQWRFNNNPMPGQTNATLVLTNLNSSQAGGYSVTANNPIGSITSGSASLTVSPTPRMVRAQDRGVATGGEVDVPVELLGLGDENSVGFSVEFNPTRLSYRLALLATNQAGVALLLNTNQVASGQLGVALTRSGGDRFPAGVSPLLRVRFQAGSFVEPVPVGFGDTPIRREVADVFGNIRAVAFSNGIVTVNSTGPSIVANPVDQQAPIFSDATFTVTASGSAPLSYRWQLNGVDLSGANSSTLTIAGVRPANAGSYRVIVTNSVGAVTSTVATLTAPRVLRAGIGTGDTGNDVDVPAFLLANGDENAVGFSLVFDPAKVRFIEARSNSSPANATLNVNTNAAAGGALGLALAMSSGQNFAAGTQQLALLRFRLASSPGVSALNFGDSPVVRELVNSAAQPLAMVYQSGSVNSLLTRPFFTKQPDGTNVLPGATVWLGASTAGSLPITWQWLFNGTNIVNATNASLVLTNITLAAGGAYSVIASNAAGFSNSAIAVVQVLPPPADLAVFGLTAPPQANAGQQINLSWSITNLGTSSAIGPWQETFQASDSPDGSSPRVIGTITFSGTVAAGQQLTRNATLILPGDLSGVKYFAVIEDSGNWLAEMDELNNRTVAGTPTQIRNADLEVARVACAASAQLGSSIPATWAVTNRGDAAATAPWNDRLFLSTASNSLAGATELASVAAGTNSPLAPGAGYSRDVAVTLPFTAQFPAGNYFIVASADHGNAQPEGNEANNLRSAPLTLTLPPLPDLAIASVAAPPGALPGEPFEIVWAVTNRGAATAAGTWNETIFFSNALSGVQVLTMIAVTNPLPAGSLAVRTQSVSLPLNGPAGTLWFLVETDSRNDVVEQNEANNRSQAADTTIMPLVLKLQVPVTQIAENASMTVIRATLTRNGDRSQPLTVTLNNSDPTELSLPASVVIGAGQSATLFDITVLTDNVVDGPQTVTIGASAVGFQGDQAQVTVLDSDFPRLTLTLETNRVREGLTLAAFLARDVVTANPLAVILTSSDANQLRPPQSVVIPGGSNAVAFAVLAVDDTLIESSVSYTLGASAAGFIGSEAGLEILDDDVPQIAVALANHAVSESAGPQATAGTVTRTPVTTRAVVVELTSSDTTAALVPNRVTIPANQASASFSVSAVDDSLVDGPQAATIGGFVLGSQSGARITVLTPDTVTVTDDDGPALRLVIANKLVREGLNPATTVTVTRNTPPTNALAVTLVSSDAMEATVPAGVTIPPGQVSETFNLASVADGVNDGNQAVTVTASATGFVDASDTVTVTDSDLPDLYVPIITVASNAETEAYTPVSYRIANQGFVPTASNFTTRIFLSTDPVVGSDTLVGQYRFSGALPVGQFFEQTFQVRMPQAAGQYWIVVQTDTDGLMDETLEDNNTGVSRTPVNVGAAYRAWVQTAVDTALAGTPVPMSGRATNQFGAGVPFKLVNLHIVVRGTDRVISALTDAGGNFAATFQPLANEGGTYQLFATHPGVATESVQDTFTLLGMRANPVTMNLRLLEGSSRTNAVSIDNLNETALNALNATLVSQPADLGVSVNLAGTTLPGAGSVRLECAISAPTSSGNGVIHVHLTTAEGPEADVYFVVDVEPLRPRLVAIPGDLVAGMARGRQVTLSFDVANLGGIPTGPLSVSLPAVAWMQIASPNPMPSLAPGETNRVTLVLTPPANLPLGPYSGSLALNSPQATFTVPFNFRALSESKGDLLVTVVDEFTFYAEGAPKVTNASVTVRDSFTSAVVTNGVTGSNGTFFASQLREGYYRIEVGAAKHNGFTASRFLTAGQTNEVEAFVNRQTVQYVWTVEPTEIEDRTRITIETVFEAYVPTPVVTIEPALVDLAEITGNEAQIDLRISNHGLIAAKDFHLNMPVHPLWEFTPLISDVGTIPARGSLTIPLTIRRRGAGGAPSPRPGGIAAAGLRAASSADCDTSGDGCFAFDCGKYSFSICLPIAFINTSDDCRPSSPPGLYVWMPPGGRPSGGGSSPGGGGGGPMGSGRIDPPNVFSVKTCEECINQLLEAAVGCVINFSGLPDGFKCGYGANQCLKTGDGVTCASALMDCLSAAGHGVPVVGQIIGAVDCLNGLLGACLNEPGKGGSGSSPTPAALQQLSPGPGFVPKTLTAASSPQKDSFESKVSEGLARKFPALLTLARRGDRLATYPVMLQSVIGDEAWLHAGQGTNFSEWFAAFNVRAATNSESGDRISTGEQVELLAVPFPDGLAETNLVKFIQRWNRSRDYYARGIFNFGDVPVGDSTDFIAMDVFSNAVAAVVSAELASQSEGYTNLFESFAAAHQQLKEQISGYTDSGGGVCAQVRLVLDQEAVITRDAFKATLEILNNSDLQIQDVSVEVRIVNGTGANSTNVFGIRPPVLENLTAVDGTGLIDAQTTGKASWILIPASDAAPDDPVVYYVSGTLRYTQDGLLITVPLSAVAITVHPNPRLFVKYFHQRDVFSDDPFTAVIEPTVPFSLAVMVENRGKGVAKNMRITSSQPRIVENEKGLLIDFQIIATEVAAQNLLPSLTVNFGAITNGGIAIGRWLLTSTLQGLFEDYKATFEHIDGLGNPKLSLIEEVTIHEMNHLVQAQGIFEDGRPDFLVNQISDPRDLPDTLYLSDGSTNPVSVVETANVDAPPSPSHLQVQLTAPMQAGWAYLRVPEPSAGQLTLTRVVREDGMAIAFGTNVWTTDRTFLGLGRRPVNENILHLLDFNSAGTYSLHYVVPPAPDTNAPVSAVAALPASSPMIFQVQWSGTDQGDSGLAHFDVLVSTNGSPFSLWLQATKLTAAMFQGEFGVNYAFYCIATDQAGNRESPHATPDAVTIVNLTNQPPTLAALGTQSIDEGETLRLTLAGTDPDGPAGELTYDLGPDAPPGVYLNAANGQITWPTGEGNGPGTNLFRVMVADKGVPSKSATNWLTVVVREVNSAPVLSAATNTSVNEGTWLTIANRAQDFDLPANTLTFALRNDAPGGATIDPNTGVFRWRPTEFQGPSTNVIAVIGTDSGLPSLSATQQFTVVVRDVLSDFSVSVGSTNVFAGQTSSVPVVLNSGLDLTNVVFVIETPVDRLRELLLQPASGEVLSSLLQPIGANRSEVSFALDLAQFQAGGRTLARLGFVAVSNRPSAIVPLVLSDVTGQRGNGQLLTRAAAFSGRVIVVEREPVLVGQHGTPPMLTLYGQPGHSYVLEYCTNLVDGAQWVQHARMQISGPSGLATMLEPSPAQAFYRAYDLGGGVLVPMGIHGGAIHTFRLLGNQGTHYFIETTTNTGAPRSWRPVMNFTLTNSWQSFDWTNRGEPIRVFRALGQ